MNRRIKLSVPSIQKIIELRKKLGHIALNELELKELYGALCGEQCRNTCAHYCQEQNPCEGVCWITAGT